VPIGDQYRANGQNHGQPGISAQLKQLMFPEFTPWERKIICVSKVLKSGGVPAGDTLAARGVDTGTLQAFMGHRSIANTIVYTAVADKRIRNIWGK
jgi:hypothetical protein